MNILYRECNINDFDKILPLFSQLWPERPLNETALKKVFAKGIRSVNQVYLCAVKAGKIVGFSSLTVNNNIWQQGNLGHIDEIIVDASNRGQGIGKELMHRAFRAARKMGCKKIELDSAHDRTDAHDFYKRIGFKNRALVFSKILDNRQGNTLNELQDYLHHKIPQAHTMAVKVETASPDGLT